MTKKYELLVDDSLRAGDRTVYRIRALRDFGDVRRGDLGGYIESEDNLCHAGDAWVYDAAQVYGPFAVVRDNARVRGCAWVMGRVEDDAQVDDLAIVAEGARVGGREILLFDEIVGRDALQVSEPSRAAVSSTAASWFGRSML
jgi:hypothetical protein